MHHRLDWWQLWVIISFLTFNVLFFLCSTAPLSAVKTHGRGKGKKILYPKHDLVQILDAAREMDGANLNASPAAR
jgi:hypothetical protein